MPGEWLFGTTVGRKHDKKGEYVYVWKLDLDSNHDPRGDNLEVRQLEKGKLSNRGFITGVYPKMIGDKIYMVFYKEDKEALRYMEFDFTASEVDTSLLFEKVLYFPYTIFMGTKTGSIDGLTVYESYTIGTSKKYKTVSGDLDLKKESGAIFATI